MALSDYITSFFPAQKENTSITAPKDESGIAPMHEEIKKAKLNGSQIDKIFQLVGSGRAVPGTVEYMNELGIGFEQNGMAPTATFGPFGSIRDAFSPKAQDFIRKQEVATKIGELALQQMVDMRLKANQAPQSLQEAQTALPGMIQPVESQRKGAPLGPMDQGPIAPFDPNAKLTPFQTQLALQSLGSLGEGRLMPTGEGIVPTSYATVQGRAIQPEMFAWGERQAVAPLDKPLAVPPAAVPQSLANKILEERGQMQRQQAKGIDFNNRLESLTAIESVKRFGRPMNFGQVAAEDPAFAAQLRQKAEIDEQKDIYSFQQDTMMQRNIKQTGPVTAERAKAERQQPVGGAVTSYGRMAKDGMSIDRPNDPTLNQDDLNKSGYVDLSKFQKEVDAINDLNIIDKDFAKLKSYADELFKAKPGLLNIAAQKGKLFVARMTNNGAPTNVQAEDGHYMTLGELANTYTNEVNSMLEYYGRNLKGLRGAATEGDVKRMEKNFAGDFTSQAVKDKLMGDTQRLIGDIRKGAMTNIFGASNVKKSAASEDSMRLKIRELLQQGKSPEEIKRLLK